eukprot:scaffold878_cov271-Pinguiococcus_pyrenoidosus.AAC.15
MIHSGVHIALARHHARQKPLLDLLVGPLDPLAHLVHCGAQVLLGARQYLLVRLVSVRRLVG